MAPPYFDFFFQIIIKFKIVPETKTLESFDDIFYRVPFDHVIRFFSWRRGSKVAGKENGCNFVQGNILEKQHETNSLPVRSCSD